MPKFPEPKKPGYVCLKTGRVAVLVSDLAKSDLNGDAPAYYYDQVAGDLVCLDKFRRFGLTTPIIHLRHS